MIQETCLHNADVSMTTNCSLFRTLGTVSQCTSQEWSPISSDLSGQKTRMFRFVSELGSVHIYVKTCCQEAAADCLQNIRKLALACEKFRYQHLKSWWFLSFRILAVIAGSLIVLFMFFKLFVQNTPPFFWLLFLSLQHILVTSKVNRFVRH